MMAKRVNENVPCPNILWMVEQVGRAEASEHLSIGKAAIGTYVNTGHAPPSMEKLATYFRRDQEDTRGTLLMMVKVPRAKRELVQTFLKGAEIKFMQFEDQ